MLKYRQDFRKKFHQFIRNSTTEYLLVFLLSHNCIIYYCNLYLQLDASALIKALHLIREHPEWNIFLYKNQHPPTLLEISDR